MYRRKEHGELAPTPKNDRQYGTGRTGQHLITFNSRTLWIDSNPNGWDPPIASHHASSHWLWFFKFKVTCLGTDGWSTLQLTNQLMTLSSTCCTHVLSSTRSSGHCRRWRKSKMSTSVGSFASGQRRMPTLWFGNISGECSDFETRRS